MNKRRLIWGVICLAIAVFLAIFYFALPEVDVVFKVGGTNIYYIPILILAAVGILLLATVRK